MNLMVFCTALLTLQSFEVFAKSTNDEEKSQLMMLSGNDKKPLSISQNVSPIAATPSIGHSKKPISITHQVAPLAASPCDPFKCRLPDCFCGQGIPHGLPPDQTPQFVLLTFDDAINPAVKQFVDKIFGLKGRKRTNPDGCSIKATFYVSHTDTIYSMVQDLYSHGHEMASHTINHERGNKKAEYDEERWRAEIVGQKEMMTRYGGVHPDDIKGVRFPYLEVGGDQSYRVLKENNFLYDSSLSTEKPMWPYTLEYQMPGACKIPPCPKESHPGLWEIPLTMMQGMGKSKCNMWDTCARPEPNVHKEKTKYFIRNMFMKNFESYYTGKDKDGEASGHHRTPFPLFWHAATFLGEDVKDHKYQSLEDGFLMFIDMIRERDDVFFVTSTQLIHWMKDPKTVSEMRKRKSKSECRAPFVGNARHCTGTKDECKCNNFTQQQWSSCKTTLCPGSFPTIYNIDGMNGTTEGRNENIDRTCMRI